MRHLVAVQQHACEPIFIGITGGTGSGKSTFAEQLRARFGADAVLISHDDYYKNLPDMTDEEAAVYNFDSPDALDTHLLVEHLHALKNGEPVDLPSYNYAAYRRTEAVRHVEPAPVIIVEGLLIMCDSDLLDLLDLIVFIDAEPDIRVIRRFVRDCRERGATLERAVDMYLRTAKPAHEKYVEPFKDKADIVVSDSLSDHALELVEQRIASLL